jgi:hypothetical protein
MRFLALFGVLIGEGAMMVHPQPPIKMGREITAVRMPAVFSSPRQPEHDEQCAIEVFGCFPINMADDAPNPVLAEGDHLVRHNLRAKAKAV